MIKAIGFLNSLSGDLVMCSAVAKQFKLQYPNSHLTLACAKPFGSILPLFYQNKYIDDLHIWNSYNDWPNKIDIDYINKGKFNIVFDSLPKHTREDWFLTNHYIEESCLMLGLDRPKDLTCELVPWFGRDEKYSNYISISAFPSKSKDLTKTLSLKKWEIIVKEINELGFRAIQLGGKHDLQIEGAEKPDLDWVSAAQVLYSSKLQITCDTSWSWIGSAYKCHAVGLYGLNYPDMIHPWSHMPVNDNASYLWNENVNDIPLDKILQIIKEKLKLTKNIK